MGTENYFSFVKLRLPTVGNSRGAGFKARCVSFVLQLRTKDGSQAADDGPRRTQRPYVSDRRERGNGACGRLKHGERANPGRPRRSRTAARGGQTGALIFCYAAIA